MSKQPQLPHMLTYITKDNVQNAPENLFLKQEPLKPLLTVVFNMQQLIRERDALLKTSSMSNDVRACTSARSQLAEVRAAITEISHDFIQVCAADVATHS